MRASPNWVEPQYKIQRKTRMASEANFGLYKHVLRFVTLSFYSAMFLTINGFYLNWINLNLNSLPTGQLDGVKTTMLPYGNIAPKLLESY